MKQLTPWQNISTVNSRNPLNKLLLFGLSFILISCGAARSGSSRMETLPDGPNSSSGQASSSLGTLMQGLNYLREHPTSNEPERIQRFLWLDRWIKLLQDKNRLSPEQGREFWTDLTAFVRDEPALGLDSVDKVLQQAQSKLGKNVAHSQRYQILLKEQSVESALKELEVVEPDDISDLYSRAQEVLALNRNRPATASKRVGVLVPLTGNLKAFGEEVVQSIQIVSQMANTEGVEFIIEDSGETRESLIQAFEKLALRSKVTAIIGPLTPKDTEIVFERAQVISVPVISLAQKESLESFGPYTMRSTLTIEDQVKAVSKFIQDKLRAKRIAVMMPDSPYGWDVMERAKKEFESRGLQIVATQVYASGSTDFKDPLRKLARLDFPRLRKDEMCPKKGPQPEGCAKKAQDLKPLVDFEVLFVPDYAETIGLMLPTLPYLGMYGVQVIGLSAYNSPRLLERGGEAAEGVIFTDGFLPSADDFQTRYFHDVFVKAAKREPTRLAAESFDLALLVAEAMKHSGNVATREGLLERIRSVNNFPGVTGSIYFEEQKLKKQPRFIIVRDGQFKEMKLSAR